MRHLGGCTECFTIWWACRCPLRCEECGAGYRDDGNSSCGTVGCQAGQRRIWAMMDRLPQQQEIEAAAPFQCEAVETAGGSRSATPSLAWAPDPERGERNVTPLAPIAGDDATADPSLDPVSEGGAMTTPPLTRPPERRKPAAKDTRRVGIPQPSEPAHRPVAERRAAVEALLSEGLSDREIARRVKVSPSTVSAVRKAQKTAKFGT